MEHKGVSNSGLYSARRGALVALVGAIPAVDVVAPVAIAAH